MARSSLEPSRRWAMLLRSRQRDGTWAVTPVNVTESGSTGDAAVAP